MSRAGGLFASHEYLTMVERDALYLTVVHNGDHVAALPVYTVPPEGNPYYQPALHFPQLATGLLAGSSSGYHNHLILHENLTAGDRGRALKLLIEALREQLAERRQSYSFFLFLTMESAALLGDTWPGAEPELGYVGDAWLKVPGASFDDYLGSLSRDRRQMVRREMRRFAEAGLAVSIEDPREIVADTARLMAQLEHKYGVPAAAEQISDSLAAHYKALGGSGVAFVCRRAGTPIGVALGFTWGRTLYMRMAGFDYEALPGKFEYFNLVLYEPIRFCLDNGLDEVHLGATAHQAKIMRGARVSPMFNLVIPAAGVTYPPPGTAANGAGGAASYWAEQQASLPHGFDTATWSRVLSPNSHS